MAVKIKLMRMGKIRAPYYRIVVADSRTKRDGRAIEEIGKYHPTEDPSLIEVDSERAQYWLGVGAQPTEPVAAILKVTGDWQKFKGLPGAEGTLRVAAAKADKKAVFEAAAKESARRAQGRRHDAAQEGGRQEGRRRGRRRLRRRPPRRRAEAPAAEAPAAEAPAAEAPAEAPAAEAAATRRGTAAERGCRGHRREQGLTDARGGSRAPGPGHRRPPRRRRRSATARTGAGAPSRCGCTPRTSAR